MPLNQANAKNFALSSAVDSAVALQFCSLLQSTVSHPLLQNISVAVNTAQSQSEYRRSMTASQTVVPACTERYSVTMSMSVTRTQHSYRSVSRAGHLLVHARRQARRSGCNAATTGHIMGWDPILIRFDSNKESIIREYSRLFDSTVIEYHRRGQAWLQY